MKKGDTVITNAGFIGRIVDIDGEVLTLDLGETRVKLGRPYVAGLSATPMKGEKAAREDKSAKQEETVVKDENGFVG